MNERTGAGATGSRQELIVETNEAAAAGLLEPDALAILARAYWRHVRRSTLGLFGEVEHDGTHRIEIAKSRVALLTFEPVEIRREGDLATITWRIVGGWLVAPWGRDRGHLRIEIRRTSPTTLHLSAEVTGYVPRLRGRGRFSVIGERLYRMTQVQIHRWITSSYLRSIQRSVPGPATAR